MCQNQLRAGPLPQKIRTLEVLRSMKTCPFFGMLQLEGSVPLLKVHAWSSAFRGGCEIYKYICKHYTCLVQVMIISFCFAVLYSWSHDCLVVSVRESQHDLNSGLGIIVNSNLPRYCWLFFFQIYLLVVRSFKFSMFKHVGRDLPERRWKYINGWWNGGNPLSIPPIYQWVVIEQDHF